MEPSSSQPGPKAKPVNLLEELPELQKLVVQAHLHTNALTEAKAACIALDHAKAHKLVCVAREQYCRKYKNHLGKEPDTRGLNKADAQKALARHRQINDTLARFDRILPVLERMSQASPENRPEANRQSQPKPTVKLPESLRHEIQQSDGADAQFQALQAHFHAAAVQTSQQIRASSFYALRRQAETVLLFCKNNDPTSDSVEMPLALPGQALKPILRRNLLDLGKQNRLYQLDLKMAKPESAPSPATDPALSSGEVRIRNIEELFASLIPAAKSTGMGVNVDAIVFVRDHDLPRQEFRSAFNTIDGLYRHLESEAGKLALKIKSDEHDHAAGVLKMSALEWQRKKQRDTEQTTKVNSALRYFRFALDQLNTLISPIASG
jgi:hypothetical protein